MIESRPQGSESTLDLGVWGWLGGAHAPARLLAGIINGRVNKYSYDNAAIIARRVFQRTAGSVRECQKVLVARLRIVVVIGVWPKGPNEEPGGYLVMWEKPVIS